MTRPSKVQNKNLQIRQFFLLHPLTFMSSLIPYSPNQTFTHSFYGTATHHNCFAFTPPLYSTAISSDIPRELNIRHISFKCTNQQINLIEQNSFVQNLSYIFHLGRLIFSH